MIHPIKNRPCETAGNVEYHAPPALAGANTRGTCYACGLAVCTSPTCSRRVQWYNTGRRRVCRSCLDDLAKDKRHAPTEAQLSAKILRLTARMEKAANPAARKRLELEIGELYLDIAALNDA